MATLLASDLHLDSETPWAIDAFIAFLAGPARQADALYLLGDIFEVWVGDDDDNPDNARTCAALRELTAGGVPAYAIHGNRDFLLGEEFSRRTGVKLLPDPVLVDLYGTPTLLSHGDVFCTEDPSYQQLRSTVREPGWQAKFLALPLAARRSLASAARAGSKQHTQRTIPTIMDVNPDAVVRAFRATGARRLIHGHTHRPALHPDVLDGEQTERVVLAPWYETASCLAVDANGVRVVDLKGTPPAS
jgi:UDP-2,3-diacylglucosamine hydrolase